MGRQPLGRLRFVTKYHMVDSLLDARHEGHTRFRFSINAEAVVRRFEPGTSPLDQRMEAARKVYDAGYPLGFIIAPIMVFDGWEEAYASLLGRLREAIPRPAENLTFELITHRFTMAAKRVIQKHYPKTKLDLDETRRKKKWGRYGRSKFVYPNETMAVVRSTMEHLLARHFPESRVEYFT